MRQPSPQDKFKLVKEGKMSKGEFVRQMRQQFPNLITNLNVFEDTVQILKNKSYIFEQTGEKKYDERPALNYSLDALERGVRYELQLAGFGQTLEGVTEKDATEAKKKAQKNLEKNPNHYLDLIAVDGPKTEEKDKPKTVKRGSEDVDSKNGMFKVKLKEGVEDKRSILQNAKREIVNHVASKYRELGMKDIKDFFRMHGNDILAGADPIDEFENYISVNFPTLSEKKGKDLDGDGDIDSDDYMAAKDKAIKKAMGKKVNELSMGIEPEVFEAIKQLLLFTGAAVTGARIKMVVDAYKKGGWKDVYSMILGDDHEAEQVKEAVKSIITKVLSENTINEAATMELASKAEQYPHFKDHIIDLQNIVTEVEKFKENINKKINATFSKMEDVVDPGSGMRNAGLLAPTIEGAFKRDLSPILKGFVEDVKAPKMKRITQADIDAMNAQEPALEEEPKQTVFTPRK